MEELLNELGEAIVVLIRKQMETARPRFSKRGEIPKGSYNFVGTGRLKKSVDYKVVDEEIIIIMEDYGVEYVFSDLAQAQTGGEGGSFPGGGKYYPDKRKSGQKAKFSPLIKALTAWASKKFQIPPAEAKNAAFAVRTSLFKAGYKGLPLFTEQLLNNINAEVDRLLKDERFAESVLPEDVREKIENLLVFGKETYNLAIGE